MAADAHTTDLSDRGEEEDGEGDAKQMDLSEERTPAEAEMRTWRRSRAASAKYWPVGT